MCERSYGSITRAFTLPDPMGLAAAKLSDEELLINPEGFSNLAFDPPSPGCTDGLLHRTPATRGGCSDGDFTRTFAAPTAKGKHTYFFVVSSEGRVTGDRRKFDLESE